MTDEQLSALLRLKRYEQPPAQYFDRLLQDIHRRQRAELLQRPLWKIAAERVQTFFSEHSMGSLSYAGALASVLVVGVAAIGLMTPGGSLERQESLIAVTPKPPVAPAEPMLSLENSRRLALGAQSTPSAQPVSEMLGSEPRVSPPRYVIDARPVSYEPSASVSF